MKDVQFQDYNIGAMYSVSDEYVFHINVHHNNRKGEDAILTNNTGDKVPFHKVLLYALNHEELHIVLHKLGIDWNIIHCDLISNVMSKLHGIKYRYQTKIHWWCKNK